ncbi:hypothetical protein BJG93_14665 [Paraburkholderia sprentiae WSM5005]|uniref:DUF302 domain-containing protein n=1 Tax=Paraburkholderia sprentiae WSM5005 TaxID=754502 RepID=A0A1I9YJL4_9BURK|nr:hypothetical protein [Paraburkholderia sprentiae]APA86497.1 hypothetical protein BJG93_14665 [Paraburkholderia sprentiae WSM5005]
MKKHLVLLILAFASGAVSAVQSDTPAEVSAAIGRQGANVFFRSLDEAAVDRLFDRIGAGRADWVALAPKLAEGADGANAEGLGIALAYALPRNPAAVLKVVDPVEGDSHILAISRVCGIPFIEDAPKNYKTKALRAVSAVTTVNRQIKTRCLDALRKS